MIYDYANQYWDHLFNDGPVPPRTDRKVTIDQHLAWPETRISNLLTWISRPVEGWSAEELTQRLYHYIDIAEDQEAHF